MSTLGLLLLCIYDWNNCNSSYNYNKLRLWFWCTSSLICSNTNSNDRLFINNDNHQLYNLASAVTYNSEKAWESYLSLTTTPLLFFRRVDLHRVLHHVFTFLATHILITELFNIISDTKLVNLNLSKLFIKNHSFQSGYLYDTGLLTLVIGGHTLNLGETSPALIQPSCLIFFY